MATLKDAFRQMSKDFDLTRRFTEDPEGVLRELGVDPSGLTIQPIPRGNAPFSQFQNAVDNLDELRSITVCGSVGYIACATVGGPV
jgi:hypothetical protein